MEFLEFVNDCEDSIDQCNLAYDAIELGPNTDLERYGGALGAFHFPYAPASVTNLSRISQHTMYQKT